MLVRFSQVLCGAAPDFPPLPSNDQDDMLRNIAVVEQFSDGNVLKESLKEGFW